MGGPINDDDSAARSGDADGPLRTGELAESSVGVGVREGGGREGTTNGLDVGAETDRIVGAERGCIAAGLGSLDDGPGPATGRWLALDAKTDRADELAPIGRRSAIEPEADRPYVTAAGGRRLASDEAVSSRMWNGRWTEAGRGAGADGVTSDGSASCSVAMGSIIVLLAVASSRSSRAGTGDVGGLGSSASVASAAIAAPPSAGPSERDSAGVIGASSSVNDELISSRASPA